MRLATGSPEDDLVPLQPSNYPLHRAKREPPAGNFNTARGPSCVIICTARHRCAASGFTRILELPCSILSLAEKEAIVASSRANRLENCIEGMGIHGFRLWRGYAKWELYLLHGVLLAPLCLAFLVSFLVTPEELESDRVVLGPPCLFLRLFGAPCPSCGMSRAFCAISHGEFMRALQFNSASLLIYAAAAALLIAGFYSLQAVLRLNRKGKDHE